MEATEVIKRETIDRKVKKSILAVMEDNFAR